MLFNVCELDLDKMTLILKLDLLIKVTYLHTKMKSLDQMVNKLWLKNTEKVMLFINACDIDFDQMTLILKYDLDIIVTYFHA